MLNTCIGISIYLIIGWVVAKACMYYKFRNYKYSELSDDSQAKVLLCLWLWWLVLIIVLSSWIESNLSLTKLLDKIL